MGSLKACCEEAQESGAKKYQTSKAWIIRAGQRRCAITGITTPGSALIAIHSTSLPPATLLHSLVQRLGTRRNAFGTNNVLVPSVCTTVTERSGGSNAGKM